MATSSAGKHDNGSPTAAIHQTRRRSTLGSGDRTRTPTWLLRQYFPKGKSLDGVTQERLDEVAAKLNRRPRKTLGFQTPAAKLAEPIVSP